MEVASRLHAVLDSRIARLFLIILLIVIAVFLSVKIGAVALFVQFLQIFEKWALLQLTGVAFVSLAVNALLINCVFFLLKKKIQQ